MYYQNEKHGMAEFEGNDLFCSTALKRSGTRSFKIFNTHVALLLQCDTHHSTQKTAVITYLY